MKRQIAAESATGIVYRWRLAGLCPWCGFWQERQLLSGHVPDSGKNGNRTCCDAPGL